MSEVALIKDLFYDINEMVQEMGIHPSEIKQAIFLKKYPKYSAYDLKKVGGLKSFINAHWKQDDKDLKTIQQQKQHNQYVNKLETAVGNVEAFREKLIHDVSERVAQIKIEPLCLQSKETKTYLQSITNGANAVGEKELRSVVTIWSDQHFGTNVDSNEVGGKNEFNWVIGARRLGMLCEQIATYKIEKRNLHEELVILLIGDNIGGVLNAQEGPLYDLITHQICGTTSYYVQALNYLKVFYPKIRVICQPGNHSRVMHKMSKERALQQKYDSFENIIFYGLSQIFANDPKVFFNVSKTPFSDVTIQGHRVFATHGDTVFGTGNVGKAVNIARIELQVNRINADELKHGGKAFEMFCTGHVHHPVFTHVGPGIVVSINGCLIGLDPYAHGIGVQSSYPIQVMWETTRKFVQGDNRRIYVGDADTKVKYEKIITPYQMELIASKTI